MNPPVGPPPGPPTEIKIDDPNNIIAARNEAVDGVAVQELAGQSLFRRAVGRLMHPLVAREDREYRHLEADLDSAEKEASWVAAQGAAGVDIIEGGLDPALLPSNRREKRRAAEVALDDFANSAASADSFLLTRKESLYGIEPGSGLSTTWRMQGPDGRPGDFYPDIDKKFKKQILRAEHEFAEAREAMSDHPDETGRSELEVALDGHRANLGQMEAELDRLSELRAGLEELKDKPGGWDAVKEVDQQIVDLEDAIKDQRTTVRRAGLAAGEDRPKFLERRRQERLRQERAEIDEERRGMRLDRQRRQEEREQREPRRKRAVAWIGRVARRGRATSDEDDIYIPTTI